MFWFQVRAHIEFGKIFRDNHIVGEENALRLGMHGAKVIVAELRGPKYQPKDIRDLDLGVQMLQDLNLFDLNQVFLHCTKSTWEILTKFHKFEKLIRYFDQKHGANYGNFE